MASPVVTARTPTLAPGSKPLPRPPHSHAGFTLVELMVVLLLIGLVSGLAGLALRDSASSALEREALRLSALLEAGRAEARASGVAVRFELITDPSSQPNGETYRFVGVSPGVLPPGHWLSPQVQVSLPQASALVLGPEPLIPPQRVELRLNEQKLTLATDGLSPFAVREPEAKP